MLGGAIYEGVAIIELQRLLSTDGFMPHGMCYMWRPAILAVHVGADSLIALAYFTIPFTLMHFVRKRAELHFTWIFLSFAIFIVACGISHVMEIWTIWFPIYWLSGSVKIVTAESAELGFWDYDVASQTVQWDDQMFKLYGRPQKQGAQTFELWTSSLHPDDRDRTERTLLNVIASGEKFDSEFRIVQPGGETRHIKASAAVIRDANGAGIFMRGVNFDITEQRRGSEAQQQMAALVQSTTDAIITKDLQGIIRTWNPAAEELLGYSAEEIIGHAVTRLIPSDRIAEEADIFNRVKGGQRTMPFETVRLRKDGTSVEVSVTISPISGDAGQIVGASKIMRDITPARLASEALRALNSEQELRVKMRTSELKERESFLQEIHHRVKNNLQIISSLINRQARGLKDESIRAALHDCQSRVLAMAQIHEMLYQSADYARVPFAKYVRDLVARVLYASGSSNGTVGLHFEMEDLSLRLEHAIPCALIVNELVANSIKHGFPDGAQGTIRVDFGPGPEASVILSIGDDGIGISSELDLEKPGSMGVHLVRTLVKQLEGRLEIIRAPGSYFRITFPLESCA